MKTKKTKRTNYQKATERMNRETARAIAHVKLMEELYEQLHKERRQRLTRNV